MSGNNQAFIFHVSMAIHHLHLSLRECYSDIREEHRVSGKDKDMVEAALYSLGAIKIGGTGANPQ